MKRFDLRKMGHMTVPGNRLNPKPFPGRFPTRWQLAANYYDKKGKYHRFRYRGKPSTSRVVAFTKRMEQYKGNFWLYEFDRGGPISKVCIHGPVPKDFRFGSDSQELTLLCHYYPFSWATASRFEDWKRGSLHPYWVELGKHKFLVYRPEGSIEQMKDLRNWKEWLKRNIKFQQ